VLGYKRWRSELARRHADEAKKILIAVGYTPELGERVGDLLQKKRLKSDPEVQVFEDAICLTFLALELSAFALKHPDEKVIDILRKTWAKMSEAGHIAALTLAASLPPRELGLVQRALQ